MAFFPGGQLRIALVLDSFAAAYQATLVRFTRQACARRGLSLVVFPGGVIGGTSFAAEQRNRIYALISQARFDGVIILAGTMMREARPDQVREFLERFRPMPMCSIGASLEGIPSYLVDNRDGMRALTRHLVVDHGYRSLAFIGGTTTSEEGNERLSAFRDELESHGIPLPREDVVLGDFMSASGQSALHLLIEERGRRPRAIVAANDAMAMGALEALSHYPPELARQIAVCGFDNVIESDFCSPPLTTVEQPLQRLAEGAVTGLVAQLSGQRCDAVTRYETRPVFRRSCGCGEAQAAAPEMQRRKAARGSSVLEFMRHRDDILAQLSLASAGAYDVLPRWSEVLLDSFIEQIRGVKGAEFLNQVRQLLQHSASDRHGETWRFHNVLSAIRLHCLPCVAGDHVQWALAEDLLQTARTITGEAVLLGQARRLLAADQQGLITNNLGTLLGDARDERELGEALQKGSQQLGKCRLVGVEFVATADPKGADPKGATARAFFYSGTEAGSPPPRVAFRADQLVPEVEWLRGEKSAWVALPLFYRHEPLGYLLAELCLDDGTAYESLRVHTSAALWALTQSRGAPQRI